jgi:hypothetical protein
MRVRSQNAPGPESAARAQKVPYTHCEQVPPAWNTLDRQVVWSAEAHSAQADVSQSAAQVTAPLHVESRNGARHLTPPSGYKNCWRQSKQPGFELTSESRKALHVGVGPVPAHAFWTLASTAEVQLVDGVGGAVNEPGAQPA